MMNHIIPIIFLNIESNPNEYVFKTKDENKEISFRNIQISMKIIVDSHETNKNFTITVQQKKACKLEFADHLWLPFLDKPQSDIVFFAIINLQIYHILVSKWIHGAYPVYIITFNE